MKADTWMPIYWGDYAKDTGHLGAAHHGAYLMLIKHYWTQGEPLPVDDAQLWRIACADSLAHWRKLKGVVLAFFEERDGRLHHKRVEEEMAKAEGNADRRAESAKKAAEARWEQERAGRTAPRNARRTAPRMGGNDERTLTRRVDSENSRAIENDEVYSQGIEKTTNTHAGRSAPRMPDAMPGECAPPSPSSSSIPDDDSGVESLSDEPVDPAGEPASETPPGYANLPSFLRRQPHGTASLIRPDFEPDLETREAALNARPDLAEADIDRRHGEFRTWCAEKAITSHNPDATWYAFMMRTHEKRSRNGHRQPASEEDAIAAGIRESLARRHLLPGAG